MKFILFCVTLDLSDNLTETRQIGLSRKTRLTSHSHLKIVYIYNITSIQRLFFLQKLSICIICFTPKAPDFAESI